MTSVRIGLLDLKADFGLGYQEAKKFYGGVTQDDIAGSNVLGINGM